MSTYDRPLLQWQADKSHARQGVHVWPSGTRYEGQWQAGDLHGQGVDVLPDGRRYEAQLQANDFHGQGVLTFLSGTRYEGQLQAGRLNGQHWDTLRDGGRCEDQCRAQWNTWQALGLDANGHNCDCVLASLLANLDANSRKFAQICGTNASEKANLCKFDANLECML